MTLRFDRILVVDWSAASAPTPPRPAADAIWIGEARADAPAAATARYHRTRAAALADLAARAGEALAAGERMLVGADFAFGFPQGLAARLTGRAEGLALWAWLARRIADGPDNRNNRFAVAAAINARLGGGGPFWGRPATLDLPALPARGRDRSVRWPEERRLTERRVPAAQPVWKLYTAGSVGGQALTGIAALARLRAAFGPGRVGVWPFEAPERPVVLAEVYPSLLAAAVGAAGDPIRDRAQVRLLACALARLEAEGGLAPLFAPDAPAAILAEEGWILGAGAAGRLAAALDPPPEGAGPVARPPAPDGPGGRPGRAAGA